MKTVIEYNAATGAIRRLSTQMDRFADAILAAPEDGEAAIEVGSSSPAAGGEIDQFYVDTATDTIQEKAAMAPAVSTATGQATIANLPVPCTVSVDDTDTEVTDGQATISFDEPGDYRVILRARPQYLDHTLEVSIP